MAHALLLRYIRPKDGFSHRLATFISFLGFLISFGFFVLGATAVLLSELAPAAARTPFSSRPALASSAPSSYRAWRSILRAGSCTPAVALWGSSAARRASPPPPESGRA